MGRKRRVCRLVLGMLAAVPTVGWSGDWINPGGGDWNDPLNWSDQAVPSSITDPTINLDSMAKVILDSSGVGRTVRIASDPGRLGSLEVNGDLAATWLIVGRNGIGHASQSGSVTLQTGLALGSEAGGNGSYNLDDGTLVAQLFQIGNIGTGLFTQNGGKVVSVVNDPESGTALMVGVGNAATGNGSYLLNDGEMEVRVVSIGGDSTLEAAGEFTQFSGLAHLAFLDVRSHGSYTLRAGNLRTGESAVQDGVAIGVSIRGAFTQSGGDYQATTDFSVDGGSYLMTGGALTVYGNANLHGSEKRPAHFIHRGGSIVVVPDPSDPFGFQGGFVLQSHSIFDLSASADFSARTLSVGHSFDDGGTINQSGGVVSVSTLEIGGGGDGQYVMTDGDLGVLNETTVGRSFGGAGTYLQSGGNSGLGLLSVANSKSVLRISGGTLSATQLFMTGGSAEVSGGQVRIGGFGEGNIAVRSGSALSVRGGLVQAGELTLEGDANTPAVASMSDGELQLSGSVMLGSASGDRFDVAGGMLTTGNVLAAPLADTSAHVTVFGSSTQWTIHPGGSVAQESGNGTFDVDGGAQVEVSGTVYSRRISVAGSGKIHLSAGQLVATQVEVRPGGTLGGAGTIHAIGSAPVSVINNGTLSVDGDYTGTGVKSQQRIVGDYVQGAQATLKLTLDDQNRVTAGQAANVPLVITGSAAFNGDLQLDTSAIEVSSLNVGDRFELVQAGAVTSRFSRFSGSIIKDAGGKERDDVFFGLNYRVVSGGAKDVSAIVLETPRRIIPGTNGAPPIAVPLTKNRQTYPDKLVLVTHGWNSDASTWARQLAAAIAEQAPDRDVVTVDWSAYTSLGAGPWNAATTAIDVGQSLNLWMDANKLAYSGEVHLIGHSAGSWLVDALSDQLNAAHANLPIHVTFLDSFDDPGHIFSIAPGTPLVLGDKATFAEQVVDRSLVVPFTRALLPNAFNLDVTYLAHEHGFVADHAWPYLWYTQTVPPANPPLGATYGYPLSTEAGAPFPGYSASLPKGGTYIVPPFAPPGPPMPPVTIASVIPRAETSVVSDTGRVAFNEDGSVTLATGSPVLLTIPVELSSAADMISFTIRFPSDADGLLSLYLDGTLLLSIDSMLMPEHQQARELGGVLPTSLDAGLHTLLFRLDPDGGAQAMAQIGDIRFLQSAVAVPEPSASVLVCSLYGVFLRRPARRRWLSHNRR